MESQQKNYKQKNNHYNEDQKVILDRQSTAEPDELNPHFQDENPAVEQNNLPATDDLEDD